MNKLLKNENVQEIMSAVVGIVLAFTPVWVTYLIDVLG